MHLSCLNCCCVIAFYNMFCIVSHFSDDHARPLMVPRQSEDQPSLLGNAREPPHLEGVIHMSGQIVASNITDVAVRAPDGSLRQIDSLQNDQLGQQGVAPGFENMPVPVPANENANRIADGGQAQDNGRDENQRDYGPAGQREADVNRHESQKDVEQKAGDDKDDYADERKENNAQQPLEVRTFFINFRAYS